MPTNKYLHNIDLDQNELISPVLHKLDTAPTSAVDGQMYYNTTTKKVYYYNSTTSTWTEVGAVYNIYNTDGTLSGNRVVTMSGTNTLTLAGSTSVTQFFVNTRTQFNGALYLYDALSFNGTTSANKTIYANELTFTTNNAPSYSSNQTRFTITTDSPSINSGAFTSTLLKLLMPVNTGTQAGNSKALVIDFNVTSNAGVLTALETVQGNVLLNSTSGGTYIGYSAAPSNTIKLDVNGSIQFGTTSKTTTTDLGEFNVLALQNDAFLLFNGRTDFTWGIKKPNSTEIIIRANSGNDTQFVFNSSNRFGINIVPTSIIHTAASATVLAAGGVDVKGINFANTLIASHNNDKLIALDLNTTYTAGSFTGVNTIDLRTSGMNVVFGSSFGYGTTNFALNPEIDGVIQFIKNGTYGTKIILRPAGNPGLVSGGGGFTANYWSSIEQNEVGLYISSGGYHSMNFANGSANRISIFTSDGTINNGSGKVNLAYGTILGAGGAISNSVAATFTVSTTGGTLTTGTYYYRIAAIDPAGIQSAFSSEYTVTIGAGVTTGSVILSNVSVPLGARGFKVYRGTTPGVFNSLPNSNYTVYTTMYVVQGGNTFTDINGTPTLTSSFAPQNTAFNTGSQAGITSNGILYGLNMTNRQISLSKKSALGIPGMYVVTHEGGDEYILESNMGPGTNYIFGSMQYATTSTWLGINIVVGRTPGAGGYVVMNNSTTIGDGFGYPTGTLNYVDSLVIGRNFGYGILATTGTVTKSTVIELGNGGFWTGSLSSTSGANKSITDSFIWKTAWGSNDFRVDSIPDTLSNVVMFGSQNTLIYDVWFGNGGTALSNRPDYTIHGSEVAFDPSPATIAGGGANLAYFNNISGGSLILAGGRGRGTGIGGDVIINTSSVTASGYGLQTLSQRVIVKYDTGNVGIGFTSAALTNTYKLDVNGSIRSTTVSPTISVLFNTGVDGRVIIDGGVSGATSASGGTSTAPDVIAIGRYAGANLSGAANNSMVCIGVSAGLGITSGGLKSIFIGRNTGRGILTGTNNIIIGATDATDLPSTLTNSLHILPSGYEDNLAARMTGSTDKAVFIGGGFNPSGYLNDFYFGAGGYVTDPSVANLKFYAPSGTGTNIVGANFIINAGRGTGTGTPGDFIIATSTAGTTGTTVQTLTNRWWVKGGTGALSNVASPSSSAALQIDSITQGFLPPRMLGTQAENIGSPAAGLIVYATSTGTTINSIGWWGYNGTTWKKLDN